MFNDLEETNSNKNFIELLDSTEYSKDIESSTLEKNIYIIANNYNNSIIIRFIKYNSITIKKNAKLESSNKLIDTTIIKAIKNYSKSIKISNTTLPSNTLNKSSSPFFKSYYNTSLINPIKQNKRSFSTSLVTKCQTNSKNDSGGSDWSWGIPNIFKNLKNSNPNSFKGPSNDISMVDMVTQSVNIPAVTQTVKTDISYYDIHKL